MIIVSLQIGHRRAVFSRSSSVPERESWSGTGELPEGGKRGLRLGELL